MHGMGLAEILHVDILHSTACVKGHDRTRSTNHLKLTGLNAGTNAAAVMVEGGHCLVMDTRKECVIIMLELIDDGQQPINKDGAAHTRGKTVTV